MYNDNTVITIKVFILTRQLKHVISLNTSYKTHDMSVCELTLDEEVRLPECTLEKCDCFVTGSHFIYHDDQDFTKHSSYIYRLLAWNNGQHWHSNTCSDLLSEFQIGIALLKRHFHSNSNELVRSSSLIPNLPKWSLHNFVYRLYTRYVK